MVRSKYLIQILILLLSLQSGGLRNIIAHEGHNHSHDATAVTIERTTYEHFKSVLKVYQEIYGNLIKGELSNVPILAQTLQDAAGKGIQTESVDSGRHMMQHIHQGAQRLRQAEGLQETQEAFASISEAVLPFFKSWPKQLENNKIKLYQCKEHENYWLQPQDFSPLCPYASTSTSNRKCNEEEVNN